MVVVRVGWAIYGSFFSLGRLYNFGLIVTEVEKSNDKERGMVMALGRPETKMAP